MTPSSRSGECERKPRTQAALFPRHLVEGEGAEENHGSHLCAHTLVSVEPAYSSVQCFPTPALVQALRWALRPLTLV